MTVKQDAQRRLRDVVVALEGHSQMPRFLFFHIEDGSKMPT